MLTQQTVTVNPSNNTNEDFLSENFKVYPNPSQGVFSLILNNLDRSSDLMITIYNVAGQEVFKKEEIIKANSYFGQINLSSSPKGMYILLIKTDQGVYSESISIQ